MSNPYPRQFAQIPQTNNVTVVFPFDWTTHQYDTSVYNPIMTHNRLSYQDLSAFFQQLSHYANQFKDIKYTARDVILGIICFFMDIMLFVMGISVLTDEQLTDPEFYDPELDFMVMMFGGMTILLSIVLYIMLIVKFTTKRTRNQGQLREKMNQYLLQVNPYFANMGLRWRLPTNDARWIELWLDFKYAEGMSLQSNQNTQSQSQPQLQAPPKYPTFQSNYQAPNMFQVPSFLTAPNNPNANTNNHVRIQTSSEQPFLTQTLLGNHTQTADL